MKDYEFVCRRSNYENTRVFACNFETDAEAIAAAKGMWAMCESDGRVAVRRAGRMGDPILVLECGQVAFT